MELAPVWCAKGIMDINTTTILGGAAGIGLLTAFWQNVKGFLNKMVQLVFVKSDFSGTILKDIVLIYLFKNYKRVKISDRLFWGTSEYVRPNERNEAVGMEIPPVGTTFWYGKRTIISANISYDNISISYIRGTFNVEKFSEEAIDYHNKTKKNKDWKTGYDRYKIIRLSGSIGKNGSRGEIYPNDLSEQKTQPSAETTVGSDAVKSYNSVIYDQETRYTVCKPIRWKVEELGQPKKDSPVDLLSLRQNVLDAVEEAIRWRSSEEWFKQRCIPWKRGWVMHGSPGTGKTAFIRALAQELNMPIIMFDLSTMTNQDFIRHWENSMSRMPCIVLVEDIDAIFEGRKNIAAQGLNQGISFDCLLNTIDGVQNTDGMFLIITTNNIDKLDPALGNPMKNGEGLASMSTRPGRIDRAIKFENLDNDGRIKMAQRIFNGMQEEKWKHLLAEGENDTGAQFQERCCRLALKLFWENPLK
jgi:hypothetical protein